MPRPQIRRPRHSTVVAYLALFLALSGGAYAATRPTTTATSVLHACVSNQTGAMRLVSAARCPHGQRSVSWNVTGQTGATGAVGAQGPAGVQGPVGTVDASGFYTQQQSDARYLPLAGIAADSSQLGGTPASGFLTTAAAATDYVPASMFGNPLTDDSIGGNGATCTLGQIELDASNAYAANWEPADGQTLTITSNTALFSLLGTFYGGNGTTTFDLPDLRDDAPHSANGIAPGYVICVSGTFP